MILVRNLGENNFYHLSQELNASVLDLLKKKSFLSYDYYNSFEKLKYGLSSKDKTYNTLINCAISHKNYEHVLYYWFICLKLLEMNL